MDTVKTLGDAFSAKWAIRMRCQRGTHRSIVKIGAESAQILGHALPLRNRPGERSRNPGRHPGSVWWVFSIRQAIDKLRK
jgi:hypothetical protein